MKLSGSRIIIETLLEQGVDTAFGYPGGAIMPLYDALYDAPLRHILTVHEQGGRMRRMDMPAPPGRPASVSPPPDPARPIW